MATNEEDSLKSNEVIHNKSRGLEIYDDLQTKSDESRSLSIKFLIASGLLFLYRESFVPILNTPLLDENIEYLVKTIQKISAKMTDGCINISAVLSLFSLGYELKSNSVKNTFALTVKEIEKYKSNKKGRVR